MCSLFHRCTWLYCGIWTFTKFAAPAYNVAALSVTVAAVATATLRGESREGWKLSRRGSVPSQGTKC